MSTLKAFTGRLNKGEELKPGEGLVSPNGKYNLEFEKSGALGLYVNDYLIWKINITNTARFLLEEDGNLVVYLRNNEKKILISINNGDHFVLMNNGNMAILSAENNQAWTSDTYRGNYSIFFCNF